MRKRRGKEDSEFDLDRDNEWIEIKIQVGCSGSKNVSDGRITKRQLTDATRVGK